MIRHPLMLFFTVLAVCAQSGCAIWMWPGAEPQVQHGQIEQIIPWQAESPLVPGDVDQITIGQHAQFWIAEPVETSRRDGEPKLIAGRILEVNANEIVVTDGVSFDPPVMKRRQSPLQRIPYYGRLFKTTGVGVMPVPIEGEVRLAKASLLGACAISESEWDEFRQQPHFERIGVDFDFSMNRQGLR